MLDGVDAEPVEIGERDPVLIRPGQGLQRGGRLVVVNVADAVVDVLEPEEVALPVLGVVVPVVDPPAAGERAVLLQLGRPDRGVRLGGADRLREREGRRPGGITPAGHGVGPPVPAGVHHPLAGRVDADIPVGVVRVHVAGVVEDNVEDDPKPGVVRFAHEPAQVVGRPEIRVHLEEILDAVPVVVVRPGTLAQDRG